MNDDFRSQIYNNMSLKDTEELVSIWQRHNSKEWTDLAFEVVEEILRNRLGELPAQRFEKHKTTSEFDKDPLPIWCEDCDQQGYIFVDDPEASYFVACKACGWETSEVWCPRCQMGGEFVSDISEHPLTWNCPNCKTQYELPSTFYDNPIKLFLEKELPPFVLERMHIEFESYQPFSYENFWNTLRRFVLTMLGIAALLTIGLLPMALAFTPIPWSRPGFIFTILSFAVWWWLMSKAFKVIQERYKHKS
jgi:hypothetical protein